MRKKMFILSLATLMIGLIACKSQKAQDINKTQKNHASTRDNSKNSLDWDGIYSTILPCTDCSGIQVKVQLSKDMTYKMSYKYLGKESEMVESVGTFVWNENGHIITLKNTDKFSNFAVGENKLTLLDPQKNKFTGETAVKYILPKANMELVEKYWKLMELMGKPVVNNAKEPHIILKIDGNRITGTGGCNTFNGSYELKPMNKIIFSQMMSTMIACPDMETESQLNKILSMVDSYIINKDTLIFNKARMAPLARFQAVSAK